MKILGIIKQEVGIITQNKEYHSRIRISLVLHDGKGNLFRSKVMFCSHQDELFDADHEIKRLTSLGIDVPDMKGLNKLPILAYEYNHHCYLGDDTLIELPIVLPPVDEYKTTTN